MGLFRDGDLGEQQVWGTDQLTPVSNLNEGDSA